MAIINTALAQYSQEHPVFYEDGVDIHLNPKIGADWQRRGQQKRVITLGQNEKYYLAGYYTATQDGSVTLGAAIKVQ